MKKDGSPSFSLYLGHLYSSWPVKSTTEYTYHFMHTNIIMNFKITQKHKKIYMKNT